MGSKFVVNFKFVREVYTGDEKSLHFYNLLIRRALEAMSMVPINRHYYFPGQARALPQHK